MLLRHVSLPSPTSATLVRDESRILTPCGLHTDATQKRVNAARSFKKFPSYICFISRHFADQHFPNSEPNRPILSKTIPNRPKLTNPFCTPLHNAYSNDMISQLPKLISVS
jgi:hypothetical protein